MAGRDVLARVWFDQACADLAAAEDSAATGHNEWACFQAQQAGEKALKAVLYAQGRTSIVTHSLRRLVRESAATDVGFADLDEQARTARSALHSDPLSQWTRQRDDPRRPTTTRRTRSDVCSLLD